MVLTIKQGMIEQWSEVTKTQHICNFRMLIQFGREMGQSI